MTDSAPPTSPPEMSVEGIRALVAECCKDTAECLADPNCDCEPCDHCARLQFLLDQITALTEQLKTARREVYEECARIAKQHGIEYRKRSGTASDHVGDAISAEIRAAQSKGPGEKGTV